MPRKSKASEPVSESEVNKAVHRGKTPDSRAKQNIPQALSVFFQQFAGAKWHLMAATAVIAIIPVVIVFLIFQKQFIKGLSDGALKG